MLNRVLFYRPLVWLLFSAALMSCGSHASVAETPLSIPRAPVEEPPQVSRTPGGGVADEIRSLVESGLPSSLLKALDLIDSRNLREGDYGRVMAAVSVTLLQRLYPDVRVLLPPVDPPRIHSYTRILQEAERGSYYSPPRNSQDYLELVLPFLAILDERREDRLLDALPDLKRARELNPQGVLAPYFTGLVRERTGQWEKAAEQYTWAYGISEEFYPAALGLARFLNFKGAVQDEIELLSTMVIMYPDNISIKRQMALAYYNNRDWARAEPAIAEVLQRDREPGLPRDGQFILMQAHLLVEQGRFTQAQAPLDLYSIINPNNRLYLFLRARVQAEGYRNRDGALNYLRSLLRVSEDDEEALVYAAQLLMGSTHSEDQAEGRELLTRLLNTQEPSLEVTSLALQDAVHRQAWTDAQPYLDRLLTERHSPQDVLFAYTVERGLGNRRAALAYAQELYDADPSNEEGVIAYISALIDLGRQSEAAALLETRLASLSGGIMKSRYYYLRSRLRSNEELVMNDLRSSLFEDPRNLNALTAMFEIYHRRKDERRAVYYLKQALALAPDNLQLRRYEAELEEH
ncbi:tetratricopeptide repeat protein [Treponema primitia]|uniref:tetratricopeptide repeat protein n=1 Tax=Treponema primitia TaxID=88058 RepID=UPI0002554C40|nr:tetratricopeptide repeat protein [Treponema primitia]